MNEEIVTLAENGCVLNFKERLFAHQNGILHYTIQCWVMNEDGKILIQRRSATKEKSAGKWDVSFGGHCTKTNVSNHILIDNVIKEGDEELGLEIKPEELIKLGEFRYTSQEKKNKEMVGVFLIHVKNEQSFIFKDSEVSKVAWIDLASLKNNILTKPNEYASRLGAILLLELYCQ